MGSQREIPAPWYFSVTGGRTVAEFLGIVALRSSSPFPPCPPSAARLLWELKLQPLVPLLAW